MCRMTPLLLLAGLAVGRATPAPSLIGAPLPAGYVVNRNFTPELSSVYRDEGRQISVALRPGNYTFLVMARDARTGRTLWKFHGQGTASVDARLAGQGAVMVTVITTGAITRSQALLLDARTGSVRRKGLFTLEGVRDGKALFMQYDEAPPSAAFLADPNVLLGEVMQVRTGRTLTRNLPIPTRPGCGPLKTLKVGSNMQAFRMNDRQQLVATRQDRCGTFQATFDWWKVPLPAPKIESSAS
ncbi:hypothetical protein [Deinococcus cavernae]|uniref:hypothetical protein n=1 Tax=Deinococcus cavernae TaxID=2320857 RepID=UPI0011C21F9E|nr:hypothetical protein [Deinococcus cavernae]